MDKELIEAFLHNGYREIKIIRYLGGLHPGLRFDKEWTPKGRTNLTANLEMNIYREVWMFWVDFGDEAFRYPSSGHYTDFLSWRENLEMANRKALEYSDKNP